MKKMLVIAGCLALATGAAAQGTKETKEAKETAGKELQGERDRNQGDKVRERDINRTESKVERARSAGEVERTMKEYRGGDNKSGAEKADTKQTDRRPNPR